MRLCRFNRDRLGLIEGDRVIDVSPAIASAALGWPLPFGDPLIAQLEDLRPRLLEARETGRAYALGEVHLNSPIAWPPKVIAAPGNYALHVELDAKDPQVDQNVHRASVPEGVRPVDQLGLFLKSSTSVVGPSDGIELDWPDRRVDHEVELAVIIGKTAKHVGRGDALAYVAGYTLALDISVRGKEDRSWRKSPDTFSVLGPAIVTPDEIANPQALEIWLRVNGTMRQKSSTAAMTVGVAELIEIASRTYTLYPGDVIMTGTPEGVGPLADGDILEAGGDGMGEMRILVRKAS